MSKDIDLLKKLRGGTFEMPSGLRLETKPDETKPNLRATAIS
jgi:hypothetical protein